MKVEIHQSGDGKVIETLEDYGFSFGGIPLKVPAHYLSDGMSVPRCLLWWLLSPCIDPVTLAPSCVHDWLYDFHSDYGISRAEADAWYYDALREAGFPRWKSLLVYVGVRVFGGRRWL